MPGDRALAASRGQAAEQAACDHLQSHGLTLHTRNYRCRGGELDLVMQERETVVFVEVRYRSSSRFGGAAASIDGEKQRKLIHAAQMFLGEHRLTNRPCRFDVVTVSPRDGRLELEWITNAIETD